MCKKHTYSLTGCCSTFVHFCVDRDNRIRQLELEGGCPGMKQALGKLIEGRSVPVVIGLLEGIKCRKGASCPDEIAKALKKWQEKHNEST